MEYYKKCLLGYNEKGLPMFRTDKSLTPEQQKEARRIYNAEYHRLYDLNKKKAGGLTSMQSYYQRNKETVKERNKRNYTKYKPTQAQYKKRTYAQNRDSHIQSSRKYYLAHREEILAKRKEYNRKKKSNATGPIDILEMLHPFRTLQHSKPVDNKPDSKPEPEKVKPIKVLRHRFTGVGLQKVRAKELRLKLNNIRL